jgi:MerR family transcriptional regulator, thiopeptide resistance regulator
MATFERITPLLVYRDIAAAHDFLVTAFGFAPGGVSSDDQGHAVHGEVCVGDEMIWLHRVTEAHRMATPGEAARSGGLVVFVDDVDAHYARAVAAGVHIDGAPQDQPYGQREYGASDPEGHRWWFATRQSAPTAPTGEALANNEMR